MSKPGQGKKVAILHPDLGIGGAENLIINIALALEMKGYKVKIYTPFFDPNRCFQECHSLDIEVCGGWFPRTIFGRFIAMCAYIRMVLCAIWVCIFMRSEYDFFILDQVSLPIPILNRVNSKVMFYCHHPDKLLCTNRSSIIMKFYRFFLDLIEELTTGMAQTIVVNSEYTQRVFLDNMPMIAANTKKEESSGLIVTRHCPEVLYPAINLKVFIKTPDFKETISELLGRPVGDDTQIMTSLNRYERKKNIPLALQAFEQFVRLSGKEASKDSILVVAGGWDPRVAENVEHERELRKVAEELKIMDQVVFLKSISNDQRLLLLENSKVLLYTPENEHFGIVPVEAMYMGCIVLACNSGGPLESVDDGNTGYLIQPNGQLWGEKIFDLLEPGNKNKTQKQKQMKIAAKQRVQDMFTMEVFAAQLSNILQRMK